MSDFENLSSVVAELNIITDALTRLANTLTEFNPEPKKPKHKKQPEPVTQAEAKPIVEAEVETAVEPPLTLEQVRAVLAVKANAGHQDEVKALIKKHGADKLSDVAESEYAALISESEVIGNAT